jgi:hypothetical protein
MPGEVRDAQETSRKVAWSIPSGVMAIATANNGVAWLTADERDGVVQVLTLLVALAAGAVWRRFDARDVTSRVAVFAVLLVLLAGATLAPRDALHPYPLMAAIGITCGALLQDWWRRFRAGQTIQRSGGRDGTDRRSDARHLGH